MYDFDSLNDRRNTYSLKWDVAENELPMWVADMDFRTAPEITEAIEKRAAHGIFGYTVIPDEWYDAYIGWWKERHGLDINKDELIFCTGVVPAISSMVRKLTTPAEKVIVMTPVYNIFFNSVLNNGRQVLESPLKYENGEYRIDFDDLEKKLSAAEKSAKELEETRQALTAEQNKCAELEHHLEAERRAAEDSRASAADTADELAVLREKADKLEELSVKYSQMESENNALKAANSDDGGDPGELAREVESLKKRLDEALAEARDLKKTNASLNRQLNEMLEDGQLTL